jgi:hypothetical protein
MNGLNLVRKVGILEGEDRIGDPYSYLQIAQAALFQDVTVSSIVPKSILKLKPQQALLTSEKCPLRGRSSLLHWRERAMTQKLGETTLIL